MRINRPSVLIVDDEVDTCRNLFDIFSDLGYDAEIAHEGRTALDKVCTSQFDVVLLDLMMPGMDGLALYQEIKRLSPDTVAILATAYPNHPRAEQSLDAGIWRLVSKPVNLGHLFSLMEEALAQPLLLIVDDDSDLCSNLWDIFRRHNYRVSMAHDVRTGADRLAKNDFQVVLLDLRLPDGNGSDLLRRTHSARTILITGHRQDLTPELGPMKDAGVDAICFKPFNLEELIATVDRLSKPSNHSSSISL